MTEYSKSMLIFREMEKKIIIFSIGLIKKIHQMAYTMKWNIILDHAELIVCHSHLTKVYCYDHIKTKLSVQFSSVDIPLQHVNWS